MKINEFESQIERLKNVYSEKSYPWNALKRFGTKSERLTSSTSSKL